MELRRLRLTGFKSFVEPAELRIEPGLTGVVGPNGCGKSNLLEALRWVMGENSPRSLRSGGMDDVIFAGTSTRPARDFAEVVLDGADEAGEQIAITRRIERGAGSAYRINGRDVRARDVTLLFADAATGAHSPALVSQGKIAQVIAARPAERRMMLEEASGIAGLHVRRRDAENRLRQTEANLARLEDLSTGLAAQITSLRRQARQAQRYALLSDEIQAAQARLLFARWRDADTAAQAALQEAQAAEQAVAMAQAAARAANEAQQTLSRQLHDQREALALLRDAALARGHRLEALQAQIDSAEARIEDLARQRQRLDAERAEATGTAQDAAAALARLEAALAQAQATQAEAEGAAPALRHEAERADAASRAAELALAQASAQHAAIEAEWRVAEAAVAQAKARIAQIEAEAARHAGQQAALDAAPDPAADLASTAARCHQASAASAAARAELARRIEGKATLSRLHDDAAQALATARADLAGIEREWQALARDREARARRQGIGGGTEGGGALALDSLAAKPGYERALAAVLGRDAQSLLGLPDDGREGKSAGDDREIAIPEGRFWIGADPPVPVPQSLAHRVRACPPQLAARLALVHVAPRDDGRALQPGEWLVTTSGQLRRWDGLVVRGEGRAEAARLEAENRLEELDTLGPARREAVAAAQEALATAQGALARHRGELVAAERAVNQAAEAERQALRARDQAELQAERRAARANDLARAGSELASRQAAARADLAAAQIKLADLSDPASVRAHLGARQAAHSQARSAWQGANGALLAHDQAIARQREHLATLRADIRGWQARAGDAAVRLAGMAGRAEDIAAERAVIAGRPEGLRREQAELAALGAQSAPEQAAAQGRLARLEAEAGAAGARLEAAGEALANAREARAGAEARAQNARAGREELARICGERFACPPPLLPARSGFAASDVAGTAEQGAALDALVAARERLGPVNLVAAAQLAQIEAQEARSSAERADLAEAVNRLRGTIGNLNREGRERLRASFETVNGHFRALFARLFEGGEAHLALVDAQDPLEAGLEIFAQPPGKRLQSLSLLSGGEQALTATALIFALFLTNPAPICVLDEVDAPLDDANTDRFCDLLEAMARETQTRYLIVTHNGLTMSRMHRLFGVTMAERGVSRLVSVELDEARAMAGEPIEAAL